MRLVAVTLAGLLVGCAANSYTIPNSELQRLSQLPPEQRAQRVLVSQEITMTDVANAQPVNGETDIVYVPDIHIDATYAGGTHGGSAGGRPSTLVDHRTGGGGGGHGGGLGGMHLSGGGSDGKAAAVAIVILAAVALFAVAGVEGSRFDGWVQLHPMMPVHLIGRDGSQAVMPLAWIDPQAAAWTEKAVIRPNEGPWRTLERKPLTRGGTYGVYGGYGTTKSIYGDVDAGPSFVIQGGYFPDQRVGILADIGFAWRDNRYNGTLFESRYMLEVQALPLVLGPLHAGGYIGGGLAYRWEDTPDGTVTGGGRGNGNDGSTAYLGGAELQLDLHTRIALTARFGMVRSHGDRQTDALVGFSIY